MATVTHGVHFDDGKDVARSVEVHVFGLNGKPAGHIRLHDEHSLYFTDSYSLEVFRAKVEDLIVELKKAEHETQESREAA